MQTLAPFFRRETYTTTVSDSIPGRIALCISATIVVALAAHVSFPLPFTPVPFTLQPLAMLGVGLTLGPTAGFVSMVAYLVEGMMGLPVFSPLGVGGIAQVFGPTGGFLMAYPFTAAIAGILTRRPSITGKCGFLIAFQACMYATVFLFCSGAGWFLLCTRLSLHTTLVSTVFPFIPGELVKAVIAAGVYSTLRRSASI